MDNKKSQLPRDTKAIRMGTYSIVITGAVIAACIIINLIIAGLPSTFTKFDTSSLKLYSISDESKKIASAISDNITVYMVAEKGGDATISELVGRYTALNPKIKFKTIDPALYPSFVGTYTDAQLSDSSLIVESSKRSYVIDYNDIYVTEYTMDEQTGQPKSSSSFAGESRITSALEYVTTDDIPVIYTLNGHGEGALSDKMKGYIRDDNIELRDLSLLTSAVPEDADSLMINMPTSDINSDEKDKILDYLKKGGDLILLTGYSSKTSFENLYEIGKYYGINSVDGLVIEGSANNYYQYPYFVLPKIGSHPISQNMPSEKFYCMMPYSMGLTIDETLPRPTVKVNQLMYTTASAYAKNGDISNLEKTKDDTEGAFNIALAVTENDTKVLWFASPFIVDDTIDYYVSGSNSSYFMSSLMWMTDKETSISIATKPMQVAALMLTETQSNVWSVIITAIIPTGIIICGLSVWLKRRKA